MKDEIFLFFYDVIINQFDSLFALRYYNRKSFFRGSFIPWVTSPKNILWSSGTPNPIVCLAGFKPHPPSSRHNKKNNFASPIAYTTYIHAQFCIKQRLPCKKCNYWNFSSSMKQLQFWALLNRFLYFGGKQPIFFTF